MRQATGLNARHERNRVVVEGFGCSSQALRDPAVLERVHRNIRQCVSHIDIMRMGHAMICPAVGSIFFEERRRIMRFYDRVFFANSDLSAISIFEEAQYHGVEAAQKILARLNGRP